MADTDFAPDIQYGSGEPRSVDDAREQISETRHRISATLDQLETRIADTKQEIRRKADVLRPVRERIRTDPWKALAIGAGAGLVLGLLTGHSDDDDRSARERHRGSSRGRSRSRDHTREARGRLAEAREHARDALVDRARNDESDPDDGLTERVGHELKRVRTRAKSAAKSRPGSKGERFLDHLVHSLTGAVSDGISERFHRGATS